MSDEEGKTNYARLFIGDDDVYNRIKKHLQFSKSKDASLAGSICSIMTTDEYISTQTEDHPEGNFIVLIL